MVKFYVKKMFVQCFCKESPVSVGFPPQESLQGSSRFLDKLHVFVGLINFEIERERLRDVCLT